VWGQKRDQFCPWDRVIICLLWRAYSEFTVALGLFSWISRACILSHSSICTGAAAMGNSAVDVFICNLCRKRSTRYGEEDVEGICNVASHKICSWLWCSSLPKAVGHNRPYSSFTSLQQDQGTQLAVLNLAWLLHRPKWTMQNWKGKYLPNTEHKPQAVKTRSRLVLLALLYLW